jgi:hypothetical protein
MVNVYQEKQARWLGKAAVILFCISLLSGFIIHASPLPRLALSAHLTGLFASLFLFSLAGIWSKLNLRLRGLKIAFSLAIYAFYVSWFVYFSAAATGTGGSFPLASGGKQGTVLYEQVVSLLMFTIVLALLLLSVLIFRGLRHKSTGLN